MAERKLCHHSPGRFLPARRPSDDLYQFTALLIYPAGISVNSHSFASQSIGQIVNFQLIADIGALQQVRRLGGGIISIFLEDGLDFHMLLWQNERKHRYVDLN